MRHDLASTNKCKWTAAPTAYNPRSSGEHSAAWKFGSSVRQSMADKATQENPSPFSYTLQAPRGKMIKMHGVADDTIYQIKKKDIPGPGTYADA